MAAMAFPCRLNERLGRFRHLSEAEEVAQSVRLILSTRRGERPLRPAFGADLDRFAFAGFNNTTQNLIRREVTESLLEWEPRIADLQVTFDRRPEEGRLYVQVEYRLLRDGQRGRVTVPVDER